jgi:excisionase family DNA binding protein
MAYNVAHQEPGRSLLIDDAAELLGVSRRTIYYRIRDGRLRTVRTRCGSQRVLLSSIETLLRQQRGLPPLIGGREEVATLE